MTVVAFPLDRLDDVIVRHECAHALVAVIQGWKLGWVNCDRRSSALDAGEHGQVYTLMRDGATHAERARVTLAGNIAEPEWPSKVDRDKSMALRAMANGGRDWLDDRVREVEEILRRERRAYHALIDVIAWKTPPILAGPTAERIVAEHRA